MSSSATPGGGRPDELTLMWTLAANADLDTDTDTDQGPAGTQDPTGVVDAERAERRDRYVRQVLREFGVDRRRLDTLALRCSMTAADQQVRQNMPDYAGEDLAGLWRLAADLLERAVALVDAADAAGPDGRAGLAVELERELHPVVEPYRQGLGHRHSWPRRLARRASPLWWARRWWAAARVELVTEPFGSADGPFDGGPQWRIRVRLGGVDVGKLGYSICHTCRLGHVAKLEVYPRWQGRGLGAAALAAARAQAGPGYRWVTTGQFTTARSYWRRVGRTTGAGYQAIDGLGCEHLDPPPPSTPRLGTSPPADGLTPDGLDLAP